FGPPDYFSLMVLGLVAAVVLAHGSLLHAFGMVVLGLLLGLIGTDVNSGAVLGILPGSGSILGSFASYSLEKKISKDPSRFGKGAIEGVAGPESANNAGAQ